MSTHSLPLADYQSNPTYGTTRDGFGHGLVEAAKLNQQVVGLCADLTESTRMHWFKNEFPNRFIEMGVAEENMIGVSAGLALGGKIPVAASYAVFSPGNSLGPLRASVCYSNLPVKIIGGHTGFSAGPDGATHQALEDIAVMRTLPNMVVVVPADEEEARKAIRTLIETETPAYLRVGKYSALNITTPATPFELGKANLLKDGTDATIIATGNVVAHALDAAEILSFKNISVRVLNLHTIKPIDTEAIVAAAQDTGVIITAEEHQKHGGLGSAVAEVVVEHHPIPMGFVGVHDTFGESGESRDLLTKYGLHAPAIVNKVIHVLSKK